MLIQSFPLVRGQANDNPRDYHSPAWLKHIREVNEEYPGTFGKPDLMTDLTSKDGKVEGAWVERYPTGAFVLGLPGVGVVVGRPASAADDVRIAEEQRRS